MDDQERKSVRIESDQFISFKLFDNDGRVCGEGMALAKDISRSGVMLENRTSIEVGLKMELKIALTDDLVNTEGVVRNITKVDDNNYQIGVEFTRLSEDELQKLAKEFPDIL